MSAAPANLPQEVRDLLAAVLEALDVPNGATVADQAIREGVLHDRALDVVIRLDWIVNHPVLAGDLAVETARLRARLAEHPPTGYTPYQHRDTGATACERPIRSRRRHARAARPGRKEDKTTLWPLSP